MKQIEQFKNLSPGKKLEFIWDYYRFAILAVICVAIILVSALVSAITYREPVLKLIMVNSLTMQDDPEGGFQEFLEAYGYPSEDSVENHQIYVSDSDTQGFQGFQVLAAEIGAGGRDILMGSPELITSYGQAGALKDLSALLPEDVLEQCADSLVYSDEEGKTERYPCAVLLTDNRWLTENQYYFGACCVGILQRGDNPEAAVQFLQFLLTKQTEGGIG